MGEPVLRVHERMEIEILEQDASPETLDARMAEAAWRPFDLEHGPLLRVVLFPWAPAENGERVLLLAVHHIVSDFWSLAVLARELGRLYAAEVAGRPVVLDPSGSRLPRLDRLAGGAAGRTRRRSGSGAIGWSGWRASYRTSTCPPTGRARRLQSHRGGSRSLVLAADLAERLRRFSREREATLYVTLLAAFQTLLHRYTGQDDLLVGSPTSGRAAAEVERVVGYFVNPVVLRADFSAVSTLDDVLARTRRTVLGALAHAELPLALLAERLQPVRDPSRPVLFQVMFVLQKARRRGEPRRWRPSPWEWKGRGWTSGAGRRAVALRAAAITIRPDAGDGRVRGRAGRSACSTTPIFSMPRPWSAWRGTTPTCWPGSWRAPAKGGPGSTICHCSRPPSWNRC